MTSDTIALIFGWVMDGLAFSAIVYGFRSNYINKKKNRNAYKSIQRLDVFHIMKEGWIPINKKIE